MGYQNGDIDNIDISSSIKVSISQNGIDMYQNFCFSAKTPKNGDFFHKNSNILLGAQSWSWWIKNKNHPKPSRYKKIKKVMEKLLNIDEFIVKYV